MCGYAGKHFEFAELAANSVEVELEVEQIVGVGARGPL